MKLTVGTKSVLFGAHCFFLHPFFVAAAWRKLYGFPRDPRLWVAFFVHDLGYWGKPNMDGPEGETHPEFGARIMYKLFDSPGKMGIASWLFQNQRHRWVYRNPLSAFDSGGAHCEKCGCQDIELKTCHGRYWHDFALLHSRYYAKRRGKPFSRLCFADKLAFALTPRWLYLPMVTATGEINEYLQRAQTADSGHWTPTGFDKKLWHAQLCEYMRKWVETHKDGAADTWTSADRHARTESGVYL